ncbi:hypothetical protein BH10ACI2_BH10ACI2_10430 [soil metagenome]
MILIKDVTTVNYCDAGFFLEFSAFLLPKLWKVSVITDLLLM